ncbi:hypothetical protein BH11PSE5_BH11PSE5_01460 [soil metagenome]
MTQLSLSPSGFDGRHVTPIEAGERGLSGASILQAGYVAFPSP